MSDVTLDAWLAIIARDGWNAARLDRVAVQAGVDTGSVAATLPDRWAALDALADALTRAALADAGDDPDASVRDRLFALLMAGFDAADRYRPALRVLIAAAPRDPGLVAFALSQLPHAVRRIAEAAGVDGGGWLGPLRVRALTVLVADVGRVWLDDADRDLAATMKALDTRLGQAERLAGMVSYPSVAVLRPAADLRAG